MDAMIGRAQLINAVAQKIGDWPPQLVPLRSQQAKLRKAFRLSLCRKCIQPLLISD